MKPLLLLIALPSFSFGQTVIVGDAWITGRLGVGVTSPSARMQVKASSAATTVFQVSGVDETPFLAVDNAGKVGIGVAPSANLDVNGYADSDVIGVQLRNGNLYPATTSRQIDLGHHDGTTDYRHGIRSGHSPTQANNSLDFFLWPSVGGSASSDPSKAVLSLVTSSTGSASVHVLPVSTATLVELEVSNGASFGAGVVHRLAESTHSSRELKRDISYLDQAEEAKAYDEVRGLKHIKFRYKRLKNGKLVRDAGPPLRRGLAYEDAPEDIRGPGQTIGVDQRVLNAEMALKELMRRLESSEGEVR